MQPTEQYGITEDIIEKLDAKAAVLTQKRKSRGKALPENLTLPDNIRQFQTLESHNVSI